jgi:hypothetical protein
MPQPATAIRAPEGTGRLEVNEQEFGGAIPDTDWIQMITVSRKRRSPSTPSLPTRSGP